MSELMLVNPRRRRRRKTRARNPRRRARKVTHRKRRRRNPVAANSRRRRRSHRRVSRRRSNPAPRLNLRSVQSNVMNALPGAFGALALDVALGATPFIPANYKVGIPGYAVKTVGAIAIGMLANMFMSARTATKMTEGALTVMFHGLLREGAQSMLPSIPLGVYLSPSPVSGLGYYGSGWNPSNSLDTNSGPGMGAYLPDLSSQGYDQMQFVGEESFY